MTGLVRALNRRSFLEAAASGLGCVALGGLMSACSSASTAPKAAAKIGYLGNDLGQQAYRFQSIVDGLSSLGYVEGQTVTFVTKQPSEGSDWNQAAAELVAAKPDLIIAVGENAAQAAQQATKVLPIVFLAAFDPVGKGLVNSLSAPGGNLTGPSGMVPELGAKWLELLAAFVPGLSRVAAIWNSENANMTSLWKGAEPTARGMGQALYDHPAPMPAGMEGAVQAVAVDQAQAIVVLFDPGLAQRLDPLFSYTISHHIPTISNARPFAVQGGLMAYGPNIQEAQASAVGYVDRILKGAKPAALPVEQPTKFDLIVNLQTANAAGLTVPASVLSQATEVIQ